MNADAQGPATADGVNSLIKSDSRTGGVAHSTSEAAELYKLADGNRRDDSPSRKVGNKEDEEDGVAELALGFEARAILLCLLREGCSVTPLLVSAAVLDVERGRAGRSRGWVAGRRVRG